MIGAIAAAVPYILQGAAAAGAIIGGGKHRYIDPEYLRQHFGVEAMTKRAQELFQKIMSSPYGNQLMSSAAEQGQRLQTDMGARAAASGLSPDQGGQSGASDFAVSASAGAADSLQREAKAGVYSQAMPAAQAMIDRERELYLANNAARNAEPNGWQRLGDAAGKVASMYPPQPAAVAAVPDATGHRAAAGPTNPNFPAPSPSFAVAPATGFLQQTQAMQQPRWRQITSGRGARQLAAMRPSMGAVSGGFTR